MLNPPSSQIPNSDQPATASLDKKDFKTLQASLASTDTDPSSLLRDALTPLLKEPLSTTSAIQLSAALRLAYPQGPKCLEFLTARYPENETQRLDITLRFILTQYLTDFAPCTFVNPPLPPDTNPVMSFSNASADDGRTQFWCIEWRSLQDRHALFQSSGMRTVLKSSFPKDRVPIPEELGKSDEDLTGEEGFRPYFRSTGASEVRSRFLGAIIVTDEYLGLKEDQSVDKRGKAGCQCIIL